MANKAQRLAAFGSIFCLIGFGVAALASSDSALLLEERIVFIAALESDPEYGEYLASQCVACHIDGKNTTAVPTIHGLKKNQIIKALLEYQNKARANTTMQSIASSLTDEDIASIAFYFSRQ